MVKQFEADHQAAHQATIELLVTIDRIPLDRPNDRYQACLQTLLTFRAMGTTMTEAASTARGDETPETGEPEPPKPESNPTW